MLLTTQISKNMFCHHLANFNVNLLYNSRNRNLVIVDAETGGILKIIEMDEYIDFETFKLIANNIYLDFIDFNQLN